MVLSAGEEKTPVVIIDDVAKDTSEVIRYAVNSADYVPVDHMGYPGVRSVAPDAYVQEIVRAIGPFLARVYSVPRNTGLEVGAYFSLVATPPEALRHLQRIPHVDSHKKYHFAMIHYLNPGEFGGTGIFRHKATGFEKITENRISEYERATEAYVGAHGEPPAEYIRDSRDQYELILSIDYQPNRLVVYPGCLLHSGLIDPAKDINADPATGRLTGNFFFNSL